MTASTGIAHPNIVIIGGGPAGLTLARILHIHSIPSTIYERDSSAANRTSMGGTLDLHEDSGQAAVKAAGLYEEFTKIMRREGEATRVADGTGKIWLQDEGMGEVSRPEIDRVQLRDMLLYSLPAESVKWGHKLRSVTQENDGTYSLHFDGAAPVTKVDIVVGADGAWSKVRPLVTEAKPHYAGITYIEVRFRDVSTRHPALVSLVGEGSFYCFQESKSLIAQRNGDDSIRVYAMVTAPEDWVSTCGIDWKGGRKAMKALADTYFSSWDKELQKMIREADEDTLVPRPLYMLPPGLTWEGRPGSTLLGDAAHLMTPWAGQGVNLAMADAMSLGQELADALKNGRVEEGWEKGRVWRAVRAYEEEMFPRAGKQAQLTWDNTLMVMKPEGVAQSMTEIFTSMFALEGHPK